MKSKPEAITVANDKPEIQQSIDKRLKQAYLTAHVVKTGKELMKMKCTLQCCNNDGPNAIQVTVPKNETVRKYGNRERYYNPDWLKTRKWLFICASTEKLYCSVCIFAVKRILVSFFL